MSTTLVTETPYGYKRIDPTPHWNDSQAYYETTYKDPLLCTDKKNIDREIHWLDSTLHDDILDILNRTARGCRVLDLGCGSGYFVDYLRGNGWDAHGIDPNVPEDKSEAPEDKNGIEQTTLDDYLKKMPKPFDAITLVNVLEHIPQPHEVLTKLHRILKPMGIIIVRVPNDFSVLQMAAHRWMDENKWWISDPDHQNYFDFITLERTLAFTGYEMIEKTGDFPMEFFLLMGDEYIGNDEIGAQCHEKRISFDLSLTTNVRRRLYEKLAEIGMGRNILMTARRSYP